MYFSFGFYSSLLLIFFVHGLVYAGLLFRKSIRNESTPDKWLAIFILLCSAYIAPWMLGFAGWYDNQPYRDFMFYVPFQHLFFIGPVIFFYVQSLLNPSFKFGNKEWLHLLPGILYLLYSLVMFVADKLILKRYYFLADGTDRDFDAWYQYAGFFSMMAYFFLSLRYYYLYRRLMNQVISYADAVIFKWVRNFLLAFLYMQLVDVAFFIGEMIWPAVGNYVGNWWKFFSFSLIFYYIAITGYSNALATKVPFRLNLVGNKPMLLLQAPANEPEAGIVEDAEIIEFDDEQAAASTGDNEFIAAWKPKILQLVQTEKAYEDPELTLSQVAKQLKTNPTVISKAINQGFQLNFNDFINFYRVEAVKEKLKAGEQSTQTLLGIAFDCGFNSKATFNRAFKKFTGVSPKDWQA